MAGRDTVIKVLADHLVTVTGAAARAVREAAALQATAAQILRVRDVEQVLLSINECTLGLLEADICGIFLREDDELVMRGCVGNHMVQTSRLRMRRGQGLAGLVFSTGTPGRVDDYLTDGQISQDFMSLAASEQTLSALAVPMRSHGDLIGVLEVWRRRAPGHREDPPRGARQPGRDPGRRPAAARRLPARHRTGAAAGDGPAARPAAGRVRAPRRPGQVGVHPAHRARR
jgi:putative methionine-R-sulfoxide reductase with GAF domain